MNTRTVTAILVPTLLTISSSLWAQENPKSPAQPADQAQMKKQCQDMKNMDMSKMSAAEHEAMMKKCKEMMETNKQKPKNGSGY